MYILQLKGPIRMYLYSSYLQTIAFIVVGLTYETTHAHIQAKNMICGIGMTVG